MSSIRVYLKGVFFCSFLSQQSALVILFRFCNDLAIHSLHPPYLPSSLRVGVPAARAAADANEASGDAAAAAALSVVPSVWDSPQRTIEGGRTRIAPRRVHCSKTI